MNTDINNKSKTMNNITTEIAIVTPEAASKYLESNSINRPVSPQTVKKYINELESGGWKVNGDTIRFDTAGRLLDGQHRLQAIAQSGIPQQCILVKGLDSSAFDTIDIGRKRTGADTLAILKIPYYSTVSAALNIVNFYLQGRLENSTRITSNADMARLAQEHPEIPQSAAFVSGTHGKALFAPAWMAAFHYLASRFDPAEADRFCQDLKSGRDIPSTDPVFHMRERLVKDGMSQAKLSKVFLFALMIKAWNMRRTETPCRVLRFADSGPGREDYPMLR